MNLKTGKNAIWPEYPEKYQWLNTHFVAFVLGAPLLAFFNFTYEEDKQEATDIHFWLWMSADYTVHPVLTNLYWKAMPRCADLRKQTSKFASVNLHSSSTSTYLTLPMASVWCCVQICSLLTQCCLSLASVAKKNKKKKQKTNEWAKPCNRHTRGTLLRIDACALLHHHQQWVTESIQINIKWRWWMVMTLRSGGKDTQHADTTLFACCLTHPWACTVPHWWHWPWRCASPRRSGRWRPRPAGACHGASGAATVHWQSTQAGLPHCSGQKTWKQQQQQDTTMSTSFSAQTIMALLEWD